MSASVLSACLFDLDGVIVDTARYHFLAWREIADELGFVFTEQDNERLKGVSRMRSLEILLEIGGLSLDDAQKEALAARKNARYQDYIAALTADDLLPGARNFLMACRDAGLKCALASASKNAPLIVEPLGIAPLFDAIVDGNRTSCAKPDPEVFLIAAADLGVAPNLCAVFEDAEAGIEAAKRAGMLAVGIGDPGILHDADIVVADLSALDIETLIAAASGAAKNPSGCVS